MTRDYFAIFFWGMTIILLTLVISLFEHEFSHSFALAVALPPSIFALKHSLQNISFTNRWEGVQNLFFATVGSLTLGALFII